MDRGSWSAEIILTLFAYKVMFPEHVHLARGNHESRGMNKIYGFDGEVRAQSATTCYELSCLNAVKTIGMFSIPGHLGSQRRVPCLQITHKFSAQMIELFRDTFCWLPLAHVLDNRVLVVHGGLFSKDGVKLSDIRSIDRHRQVFTLACSLPCLTP